MPRPFRPSPDRLAVLVLLAILAAAGFAQAQAHGPRSENSDTAHLDSYQQDLKLAQRFAPVFYFHPDEIFRPQSVDVMLLQSRLRQSREFWFDINVLSHPDSLSLSGLQTDTSYFLDVWYGDEPSSEFSNYTSHETRYLAALSPEAGGPAPVVYARVRRHDPAGPTTIQYWVLYFYNDGVNKHEGDWEMVEVILSSGEQPEWVVLSQHHGGTRRPWDMTQVEDDTHPAVYVALGSHANYFVGDEIFPTVVEIGDRQIAVIDRTGQAGRLQPEVALIPDRDDLVANPHLWEGTEWVLFRGHWGEMAASPDLSGPLGPHDKGIQWVEPLSWAMAQPQDLDKWYRNRLQVRLHAPTPEGAAIRLFDESGTPLRAAEELGNVAILHADPGGSIIASLAAPSGTSWRLTARWPDPLISEVTELGFDRVRFPDSEDGTLRLSAGPTALLSLGDSPALLPSSSRTDQETWDAPDPIWVAGVIPVESLGPGILSAALASLGPTTMFVAVLYSIDQYKKAPFRVLAAAFLWGAIPSVALSLPAEVLIRLPREWIEPASREALRLVVLAPALEETLKGAGLLRIFRKYRREFNDVLDGMIYGAMVGFGFAMTANLLSYLGSFVSWGFDGLGPQVIVKRTLHALDHGLYTAALGLALGLSRHATARGRRILPVVGLAGAFAIHSLHNALAWHLVGFNAFTIAVTGAGTIVLWAVGSWSLVVQHRSMRSELAGLLPDPLYHTVVNPVGRLRAEWRVLRSEGRAAWRRLRRLHHLCVEFALMRDQARRTSGAASALESQRLWGEIEAFLGAS